MKKFKSTVLAISCACLVVLLVLFAVKRRNSVIRVENALAVADIETIIRVENALAVADIETIEMALPPPLELPQSVSFPPPPPPSSPLSPSPLQQHLILKRLAPLSAEQSGVPAKYVQAAAAALSPPAPPPRWRPFLRRVREQHDLHVAFVGGSNTAQKQHEEFRYPAYFMRWLRSQTNATVHYHNLGVSGATSFFHAQESRALVSEALAQAKVDSFDLYILETGVNDQRQLFTPAEIRLYHESLLQQLMQMQPRAAFLEVVLDPYVFQRDNETLRFADALRRFACAPLAAAAATTATDACGELHSTQGAALLQQQQQQPPQQKKQLQHRPWPTQADAAGAAFICRANATTLKPLLVAHCHGVPAAAAPLALALYHRALLAAGSGVPRALRTQLRAPHGEPPHGERNASSEALLNTCMEQHWLVAVDERHPCAGGALLAAALMSRIVARYFNVDSAAAAASDSDVSPCGSDRDADTTGCPASGATPPPSFFSTASERAPLAVDGLLRLHSLTAMRLLRGPLPPPCWWHVCINHARYHRHQPHKTNIRGVCQPMRAMDLPRLFHYSRTHEAALFGAVHYNLPLWLGSRLYQRFLNMSGCDNGANATLEAGNSAEQPPMAVAGDITLLSVTYRLDGWIHDTLKSRRSRGGGGSSSGGGGGGGGGGDVGAAFVSATDYNASASLRLEYMKTYDERIGSFAAVVEARYAARAALPPVTRRQVLHSRWQEHISVPTISEIARIDAPALLESVNLTIEVLEPEKSIQFTEISVKLV